MLEILRKSENEIIRAGIVILMMLTTITPVEIRWTECEVWLFYGITVLFGLGMAILIWKKQSLGCTLSDVMAVAWFLFYVGRTWIGNEWPCQMEFLKTAELFLLYVGLRIAFHGTKISAWVLIGSILAFGCYEAWLGASQMYGNEISRHGKFALTGNFLNPGPYSAYLMMGVVVGLVALKNMHNRTIIESMPDITFLGKVANKMPKNIPNVVKTVLRKIVDYLKKITWRHLVIGAVLLMAMVLPATWSRAAFLGVITVVIFVYRDKYWRYRYIVWGTIIVVAIAFYFIKQGSADGRLLIWKAILTTWIDNPWFGVGIGGVYNAFAEGMTKLSALGGDFSSVNVPDNSYNILLKIVAEQGLVGGGLAIGLTVVAMMILARNSSSLFWGMVSLLVFAMFSYPFDLLPYKVIAVLIVAWSESVGGKRMFEIGRMKALLLGAFLGFASWQAGKIANESLKIERGSGLTMGYNDYSSIQEGYECMPLESDNHVFLFDFGKKLREEGRYNESNAVLSQGTRCSADPMFYVIMGNNYKDMIYFDLAEQSYKKAFAIMPNRLYPLYKLMLLYNDNGKKYKAKKMAKCVINMKPKINSSAISDMKRNAMVLLEGNKIINNYEAEN
jgi:O-antigen ligase